MAKRIFEFLVAFGYINSGLISILPPPANPPMSPTKPSESDLVYPSLGKRKRILVIGAGASGLCAARQLVRFGHEVIILEGRNRTGGRVATNDK